MLGAGLLEETIVLVPTPQSIVAEGIAELAPAMVLESGSGQAIAEIVRDAGIEFDLARALAIERAGQPLRWAEFNGALLLHDAGAGEAETQAYLERWGLMTAELATHLIRFLNEPTSRSYMITYAAGHDLCRAWVAGDPERFRRLLTEQVRVGELLVRARPGLDRRLRGGEQVADPILADVVELLVELADGVEPVWVAERHEPVALARQALGGEPRDDRESDDSLAGTRVPHGRQRGADGRPGGSAVVDEERHAADQHHRHAARSRSSISRAAAVAAS